MSKGIKSNTSFTERLSRQMSHGISQLQNAGKEKKKFETVGCTFYLLEDGRILSYKEWHWANQPEYKLSGSYEGCIGYLERTS